MYALRPLFYAAGTDTSLAWMLWIVLWGFVLVILVGWRTSLSRLKRDEAESEAKVSPRGAGSTRAKAGDRRVKTRPVSKQKRLSKK